MFEWSPEVLESAQARFIKKREAEFEEKGKVETDEETFHRMLTLAKYFAACHGKTISEQALLDQTIAMEEERIRRVLEATNKK